MNKISITKMVCRQIVRLGSEFTLTNFQKTDPRRQQHLAGHYTGELQSTFHQNSSRTTHALVQVGETSFDCYCPVLRSNQTIDAGSMVMFQRNVTNGRWEIFSVECPE